MLGILNKTETETELPLDTAAKRARIADELRHDSTRSDREIGRVCGVDGKTVGAVRKSIGDDAETSADNSAIPSRDQLFRDAAPHIDFDGEVMKDSLDRIDAIGKRDAARDALGMDDEENPDTYWPIPSQAAIECRQAGKGDVNIWQEGEHPIEDVIVHVAAANAVMLARHILYAAGFPNVSIYVHTKAGCVDVEDGDTAAAFKREANKPGYGPVR